MRSLTELCSLRVSVELCVDPKDRCSVSAISASATRSVTAGTHNGASLVGATTLPVDGLPHGNSLNAVVAAEPAQRNTVAVYSGRR